jgi:hypothetical protein
MAEGNRDIPGKVTTMKIKEPTRPKADANAVLVSWCPRCGRLIRCPGLTAIKCGGEQGCGATHDRARELEDA